MPNQPIYVPHQLTPHVKLLHKVAVVIDKKVLILKRVSAAKSRPNCWDLPGGNSEWPMDIEHPTRDLYQLDIAREVWEETGIRCQSSDFHLRSMIYFSTFYEPKPEIYTIICGWKLLPLAQSSLEFINLSAEHENFKWIQASDLTNYNFGGKAGEFIVNIIKAALD